MENVGRSGIFWSQFWDDFGVGFISGAVPLACVTDMLYNGLLFRLVLCVRIWF